MPRRLVRVVLRLAALSQLSDLVRLPQIRLLAFPELAPNHVNVALLRGVSSFALLQLVGELLQLGLLVVMILARLRKLL